MFDTSLVYEKRNQVLPFFIAIIMSIAFSAIILKFEIVSIAMLFIICFSIFFFLSPKISFLFILLIRPLLDVYWNSPMLGFKNPLYLVGGLAVIFLMIFIVKEKFQFRNIPYANLVLLFLASQMFSFLIVVVTLPDARLGALDNLLRIFNAYLMFLALPFIFSTRKDIERLINILLLANVIPLGIIYYTWYSGDMGIFTDYFHGGKIDEPGALMEYRGVMRLSGIWQGTFNVAFYCLQIIFVGILKLRYLKNVLWRLGLLGYIALSIPPLFQTYLRAGWIMAFAGLGLWFILRKKIWYLFILLLGVIVLFWFSETARGRFADEVAFITGEGAFERIGSGRGTQWLQYIDVYLYDFSFIEKLFGKIGAAGRPENQIIYLLINSGIFGLCSYLILMVGITKGLWKSFKRSIGVFDRDIALLALVLHIAFIFAWIGGTPLLWINAQWVLCSLIGIVLYQNRFILHPPHKLLQRTE